jgi:anti-sigma factor RsiW
MPSLPIDDTLILAYVDGELDPATRQRVADVMEQNAAVRERAAMFRRSTDLLRSALSEAEYMAVPEGLVARATKKLKRDVRPRLAWLALPVAAAIAGLVIGNLVLPPNLGVGQSASSKLGHLLEEVGEYHAVFARETEHVVEVPASRRDYIQAWLGNRVHYPFTVPDLTVRGLTFLGARMVAVGGGVVAQLMYADPAGERIALCLAFTEDKLDAPMQSIEKAGYRVMGLAEGHHKFIVAGQKFHPELESIAQSLPALFQVAEATTRGNRTPYGGFAPTIR